MQHAAPPIDVTKQYAGAKAKANTKGKGKGESKRQGQGQGEGKSKGKSKGKGNSCTGNRFARLRNAAPQQNSTGDHTGHRRYGLNAWRNRITGTGVWLLQA